MKYVPYSVLKYIAYISMFIDHLAVLLNRNHLVDGNLYWVMRGIGRLAFPLFLFFLVVGVKHTKSKTQYLGRLAALAIVSEVPYDLYFYKGFPNWDHQNIFFELFVCLVLLILFERYLPCNKGSRSCVVRQCSDGAAICPQSDSVATDLHSESAVSASQYDSASINQSSEPSSAGPLADKAEIMHEFEPHLSKLHSDKAETDFCPAYIVLLTAIMCAPAYFLHFSYGYKGVIATAFLYKFYQARERQHQKQNQPNRFRNKNQYQSSLHSSLHPVAKSDSSPTSESGAVQSKDFILQLVYLCLACAALIIKSTKIQYACFAVIPLVLFSKSSRQSRSKALQIALYLFYPAHILLLYAIEKALF